MWFSKHKEKEEQTFESKPNLEILEDSCLECSYCHHVLLLPEYIPLSIGKCTECDGPVFVPMKIKNYWLYRPLGGGGMGSVYKAIRNDGSETEYAVKILPRDQKDDEYLINCLIGEAEIGSHFGSHPHLIYVDDYGQYGAEHFCALEFVEGMRLDQLVEMHGHIAVKYVLMWALQILSAEQHMYDCGYLYRDLKPQNLIIDKTGNIHMIDYGLCLDVETAMQSTNSDSVEGSPIYMPPERIVGAGEGMGSEIYSLGMVMFHALSQKPYYTATGAFNMAKKHVSSVRFASVGNRLPGISPKVIDIIDKMVARLPVDRYHTYMEAAADIKAVFDSLDNR